MPGTDSAARIVIASGSVADYPQGGGHWSWFLQHLLGLHALGHDIFALELLVSTGDASTDSFFVRSFFERLETYGFRDRALLLLGDADRPFSLESSSLHGMSAARARELARSADLLWNLCGSVREPLLSIFRRRVLIDTDPGIYQLSALQWDMAVDEHDVRFTVGTNVGGSDCGVPTLGRTWRPFRPFVHLPAWPVMPDPGPGAPFTSVTHWRWDDEVFEWNGELTDTSKRQAYLRYIDLPSRAQRPFELAANIHPDDDTGDRELLRDHGWRLARPEDVAQTPESYRAYIQRSRAELACVKSIYSTLNTGWFSDRSVCYLASGRPVLCEETRLSDGIPTGDGLLTFSTPAEALAGVAEIDAAYPKHARAARQLAEDLFSAERCLEEMVTRSQ
jgi:hypothetical protein